MNTTELKALREEIAPSAASLSWRTGMTYIEAMKQALEALEEHHGFTCSEFEGSGGMDLTGCGAIARGEQAITALRTAIEEVEKAEPAAYIDEHGNLESGWDAILNPKGYSPLYLHPAPLTAPENLDEVAVGLAKELASNGWVHIPLDTLPEIARRLIAKLQEQGK